MDDFWWLSVILSVSVLIFGDLVFQRMEVSVIISDIAKNVSFGTRTMEG